MKKISIALIGLATLVLSGCGNIMGNGNTGNNGDNGILGSILGGVLNQNTANGLLDLIVGGIRMDEASLQGTWYYSQPGLAFTSENLLAKAGGAVAASNIKEKLGSVYSSVGVSSSNTYITFDGQGRFQGKVDGIPLSGTYSYDGQSQIKFKATLVSFTGYVTRTSTGMSLNFEANKLLSILQGAAALTGNSTIGAIGDLSKQYDGLRVGFDMRK